MQLKSLEVQGFKSFPDRLAIGFGEGITAIVGPNGSGKSNISDALRWVMGEQSTRTLRGSRMEDVIFGGTAARKAMGFAEVSITVDNSNRELPIEYAEVVITRRYYRSGESEFYINRKPCRLKDIHELLMDTGMGHDGYSIIGQGRITDILSTKSEDRREIFEEAAGISKYRYRKEAAQKRIEGTEQNLVRIRDIIAELESQLEPLRLQAEKARRFMALQEELKGLEIDLWADSLSRIAKNREKLKESIDIVSNELTRANAQLEEAYAKIEASGGQMAALDMAMQKLRELARESEAARYEAQNDRNVIAARVESNLESLARFDRELTAREARRETLEAQLGAYRQEAAEAVRIMEELEGKRQALLEKLRELAGNSSDITRQIEAIRALSAEKEGEISSLLQERSSLEALKSSAGERTGAIDQDIAQKRTLLEDQRSELERAESELAEGRAQMDSAKNAIAGYELRISARRERLQKAKTELEGINRELFAKTDRFNMLSEMEREYEGFSSAVKLIMTQRQRRAISGIIGTVSELISTKDEYALAIETALGFAMQNIVTEDEEAAKRAIGFLKAQNAGRATFLPLTSIKGSRTNERGLENEKGYVGNACALIGFNEKYRGIFESLLGRTAIASDIDSAVAIARKYSYRFRIVTLDGQVVNAGGSMTGGSAARSTGAISRANEIKRLENDIKTLSERVKEVASNASKLERDLNAATYEYDIAANELREAEGRVLGLEGGISGQRERVSSLESDILALEAEKGRIARALISHGARLEEIDGLVLGLNREKDELRERVQELSKGAESALSEQGSLSETLEDIRIKLAEAAAKAEAGKRAESDLLAVLEDIKTDSGEREKMAGELKAANLELFHEDKRLELSLEKIGAELEALSQKEKALAEKRLSHEAARAQAERESRGFNESCLNLERERQRLERNRLELDTEEQNMIERMWDDYEIIPSRVRELARPIEGAREDHVKRVTALKNERRGMGSVNVDAAEEYEQVSERHSFLVTQKEDLEKSKFELEEIILEVTAEMERIFSEKFRLIQESFSKTFADMFGGGTAEVFLTDPEDVLNSGIEIKVQPPGKTVKSLSLFSGGEMALVAIALFFAIFKVRPAPFCVLDEVDSALDDINVTRFASYISRLVPSTQLIIITHRRGTMEYADILYGVTMQEKGVSKLLTMNIPEIEKELKMKLG